MDQKDDFLVNERRLNKISKQDENMGSRKRKVIENAIERRLRGPSIKTYPSRPSKDIHLSHPLVTEMLELSTIVSNPKESYKKSTSASAKEGWKRKLGKFAMATPESEPKYMWLPFFELLKANPTMPEFIYLQPPKLQKSPNHDPYNLEIIRYCNLEGPYFYTMSCKGVTLFREGEAEFEPLDQWERGYNIYRCIMYLDIFRQYKIWRSWAMWKKSIRKKKAALATYNIQKCLFISNVLFSNVLMQIREIKTLQNKAYIPLFKSILKVPEVLKRYFHVDSVKIVVKIWSMRFYYFEPEKVYTLKEFIQTQSIIIGSIDMELIEFARIVILAIRDACKKSTEHLEENFMGGNTKSKSKPSNTNKEELQDINKGGSKQKKAEEEDNEERYAYLIAAAKRLEQARLINFVRLSDYLISDGLRVLLTITLEEILYQIRNVNATNEQEESLLGLDPLGEDVIKEISDDKERMNVEKVKEDLNPIIQKLLPSTQYFIVELHIRNEILTFDPSYKKFETQMESYLVDVLYVVRMLRRTMYHPTLDGIVDKSNADMDNLISYIELIGEGQFYTVLGRINKTFLLAFNAIESLKAPFQMHLNRCIANRVVTQETLRKEVEDKKRNLQMFRDDIEKFIFQEKDIHHLPNYYNVGIFHVNTINAKNVLLPLSKEVLVAIYKLLPTMASEHLQAFMNEIHAANKKLRILPRSVEEFVGIASFNEVQRTNSLDFIL